MERPKLVSVFLRSRVARRVFLRYLTTALVPALLVGVGGLALMAHSATDSARETVRKDAKLLGHAVFQRLDVLESNLIGMESVLVEGCRSASPEGDALPSELVKIGVAGVTVWSAKQPSLGVLGRFSDPRWMIHELARDARDRGRRLQVVPGGQSAAPHVLFARHLAGEDGILVAELRFTEMAWLINELFPEEHEVAFFGHKGEQVYATSREFDAMLAVEAPRLAGHSGVLALEDDSGAEWIVGYWKLPLASVYGAPPAPLCIGVPQRIAYAGLSQFGLFFGSLLLAALGIVFVMSSVQIRRQLAPIDSLGEVVEEYAAGRLDARAPEHENDEFGMLGRRINEMAAHLDAQRRHEWRRREHDRALLSSIDGNKIAETVLAAVDECCEPDLIELSLAGGVVGARSASFVWDRTGGLAQKTGQGLSSRERLYYEEHAESVLIRDTAELPQRPGESSLGSRDQTAVIPLRANGRLLGLLRLRFISRAPNAETVRTAAELVSQAGIAFHNAELIARLENSSEEILEALALAVDAKSAWTAGHSQRTSRLAAEIAEAMGLGHATSVRLRRAGLLHDVGKLGIPPEVLDKPGPLDEEERQAMQEHPRIGARILEPVATLRELVPVVLHHHEHYDGTGYPDGLAGEQIPLEARVFAVADLLDALVSERPYRTSMSLEDALEVMRRERGRQLDPHVLEVALRLIEDGRLRVEAPSQPREFAEVHR